MTIYKKFREVGNKEVGSLSSRYDQPTYMTFKLLFADNRDLFYNDAGKENYRTLNYDTMPHPLFGEQGANDVTMRETYSAIDYLLDANEYTRANMLKEFITKFNELQNNFQWYFKSIDGIEDMMKIRPESGQQILSDKRLSINMMEGVDLRITHLLNLYKKIAWDDTYQRWVLPEMMRYFTLQIYISEFRTFHQALPINQADAKNKNDLVLSVLDNVLPTWVIKCEMCEFDIESFKFSYLNSLNISESSEEATLSFNIKVGKIYETQSYPLFKNSYLIDKYLNGANRLIEKQGYDDNGYIKNYDHTASDAENNYIMNYYNINIAQNSISDTPDDRDHVSGLPFNQAKDDILLLDSADLNKNTWVNNTIKSGTALATNYANEWIDKLKMTPIPELGFSVSELGAALESKNIFSTLGLVRKSMNTVANSNIDASDKLSETLIDTSFKAFLQGISSSTATDAASIDLINAANTALNDNGVWEAIKDYSKATNLVGPGEINYQNNIKNGNIYKDNMTNDRSLATDLDGGVSNINSILPSTEYISTATNNKLVL